MDADRNDNHYGDLDEIGDEEWPLGDGGCTEGHVRAVHQAENSAEVLDGEANDAGDSEDECHSSLVARGAVGDESGDGRGDYIANEVAHRGAGESTQRAASAGEDGKADEAEGNEEQAHEEAAAAAEYQAREDDNRVLKNDGHARGGSRNRDESKDYDERGKDRDVRDVSRDGILFHGPKFIQWDNCAANSTF